MFLLQLCEHLLIATSVIDSSQQQTWTHPRIERAKMEYIACRKYVK